MAAARRIFAAPACLGFALAGSAAHALSPAEVFETAAPSVWAVRGLDAQERPFSFGSAVVVGPGQAVTTCRVLAKAKSIQLRRDDLLLEARLEHADVERDLCILSARSLSAPAVQRAGRSTVKVGQRAYAIAYPPRLGATLAEGLVSGVGSAEANVPPLQTTAAVPQGTSGGGLFDEQGRLIGITLQPAQGAHFALPSDWIDEAPGRAKEQLARAGANPGAVKEAASGAAPAAKGMPGVGARWAYSFRDRLYGSAERPFTIRVDAVEGTTVRETLSAPSGTTSTAVDLKAMSFSVRPLAGDYALLELAPYFFASELGREPVPYRPDGYPRGTWQVSAARVQPEDVVVPAGTYRALRVDVTGTVLSRPPGVDETSNHVASRFSYTAWYAPEVNRYVMTRHQTWNRRSQQIGDEVVQLTEFKR
jgi:hypothetical protein